MTRNDVLPRFAFLAVLTVFAALLWTGLPRLGNIPFVWDSNAFKSYAQVLGTEHRIPGKENYEYSLPPGQPAAAAAFRGAAKAVGPVDLRPLGSLPHGLRAVLWVAATLGAAWLLLTGRRRRGAALAAAAVTLAALDVVSAATSVPWVAYVLPDLVSVLGLVAVTGLLAREVWPDRGWAPAFAAFAVILLPLVFRIGLVVHPDPPFALLGCLALLVTLRAARRGWTLQRGLTAGALLAACALTRQSAVLLIATVTLIALVLGRRDAKRYLAGAAVAVAVLAGPWWGYQASKYGNPIQSNLDRPALMLNHEPLSFFVAVPRQTVTDPWQVLNKNELFPKFHVALWSDWSGIGDFGGPYGTRAKALAVSQSVLGFGGDALVLGGLAWLGLPALVRALRRRQRTPAEAGLAALALLFCVSWAAFLTMLIRFPQRDADPNSPHYLLFLAPAAAIFGLAAARALWRRGGWARGAILAWTALYVASWGMVLELMV